MPGLAIGLFAGGLAGAYFGPRFESEPVQEPVRRTAMPAPAKSAPKPPETQPADSGATAPTGPVGADSTGAPK